MEIKLVTEFKNTKQRTFKHYTDVKEFSIDTDAIRECCDIKLSIKNDYFRDVDWIHMNVADLTYYLQIDNDYFVINDSNDVQKLIDFYNKNEIEMFVKECKTQAQIRDLKKEFEK